MERVNKKKKILRGYRSIKNSLSDNSTEDSNTTYIMKDILNDEDNLQQSMPFQSIQQQPMMQQPMMQQPMMQQPMMQQPMMQQPMDMQYQMMQQPMDMHHQMMQQPMDMQYQMMQQQPHMQHQMIDSNMMNYQGMNSQLNNIDPLMSHTLAPINNSQDLGKLGNNNLINQDTVNSNFNLKNLANLHNPPMI
jgi:hypothetical protein